MKLEKILKSVLLGGVFLIPFIPLIVVGDMFFPFITGKNFAFRLLVEIMLGAWVVLAYWNSEYRPKKTLVLSAFALFVGIIAIADFLGENPYKSFWSNFERMEGLIGLVHLFAYFLIATSVLNTKKLWRRFFNTSLFVGMIVGIYGLFQLSGALVINQGGARVDGTFGNAAYLAIYNLFNIFIAAFFLSISKKVTLARVWYGLIIILNLIILYHTATRGVILGLIGGVLLSAALIALFERENLKVRKGAIVTLIGLAVLVGGFFMARNTAFVKDSDVLSRLATISLEGGSARFMVWNMAFEGFKEKPILGWGQENFNLVFNKYYDPGMYAQEQWFDRAHNVFFYWLIAGGILGLLAYLSLFISALYLLWAKIEDLPVVSKSILTGLFAGYFFQNLFVFDNVVSYVLFFSVLGYVHHISLDISSWGRLSEKIKQKIGSIFGDKTIRIMVAPFAVILVIFSVYFINYKSFSTSKALIKALVPQKAGVETNLALFKKSIDYDSFGTQEAREQLSRATFAIARTQGIDKASVDKFLAFTDQELKSQIEAYPEDARHHLFLASFLDKFGRHDEAIVYFEKALELSPNKQQIYFGLIGSYLNKGNVVKAFELAERAFELEPKYDEARIIYAMAAIYNMKEALSEEIIAPLLTLDSHASVLTDERFLRAYASINRYDKIVDIWEERVKNNPENAQYHLSLAAAYIGNNQRESAIQEIIGLMRTNPEFKDQGQYYIDEIRAGRNP